jgi:hypothetical protein
LNWNFVLHEDGTVVPKHVADESSIDVLILTFNCLTNSALLYKNAGKVYLYNKGKGHPITGHEGPTGE